MTSLRLRDWVLVGLVVASFALAFYVYPLLPERMATHWNAAGVPDGFADKFWGLFLFPVVLLFTWGLLEVIPRVAVYKKNIELFAEQYFWLKLVLLGFLFYVFVLSIYFNLGNAFDFGVAMMPALAVLLVVVGHLIKSAKRNFFIGIRTPWTLASDKVWEKTHALGGTLFQAVGVALLLAFFLLRQWLVWLFVALLVGLVLFLLAYSYLEWRKEKTYLK